LKPPLAKDDVQNKPRDNYPEEKTEVIYGIEDITRRTLERLYSTRVNVDSCIDPLNPSTIMNAKPIVDAMINLQKRGIMTRVITELTKDNLNSCKGLIKVNSEVRHLDEIKVLFNIRPTNLPSNHNR
jgi:two-component system, OmpR family, sensor histidine kinase VicK